MTDVAARRDLLLEVGVEELPASYLDQAREQLRRFGQELSPAGKVTAWSTPRRLILAVSGLEETITETVWGPPLDRARESDGSWSRAAQGFARSRGLAPDDLKTGRKRGKTYLTAAVSSRRQDRLAEAIPAFLEGMAFPKSMRWREGSSFRFARPIRWLLGLWGDEILPFTLAGLNSGRHSRGHRFFGEPSIRVENADIIAFRNLLRENAVIVDPAQRERRLEQALLRRLRRHDPEACESALDRQLLEEVNNLLEFPRVIEGSFEEDFLVLPVEVPVTVMKKHQRYFPIYQAGGKLSNRFLLAANGPFRQTAEIRRNNERVVRARLADARFFWDEDRRRPLSSRIEDLEGVVFHARLGSYLAKTRRLEKLVGHLGEILNLSEQAANNLVRAATLCKADLTTAMVAEFTSLQGIMGSHYAREEGEKKAVCSAIRQHYLPRGAEDGLPESPIGLFLALADRTDTIAAFFQAGIVPSGSQDPYGLRRQVLGLLRILVERDVSLPFSSLFGWALDLLGTADKERVLSEIKKFTAIRLEVYLNGKGYPTDLIRSVLAAGWDNVADAARRCEALHALGRGSLLLAAATIVERTGNIAGQEKSQALPVPGLMREEAEKALYRTWEDNHAAIRELAEKGNYRAATRRYARAFSRPLGRFFQEVLVNVPEKKLRENRLALLGRINQLYARDIADLSLLQFERGEHLI